MRKIEILPRRGPVFFVVVDDDETVLYFEDPVGTVEYWSAATVPGRDGGRTAVAGKQFPYPGAKRVEHQELPPVLGIRGPGRTGDVMLGRYRLIIE